MKRYILADEKSGLVCGLSFWRDSPPTELMPGMIVVGEIDNDEDYPAGKVWDGKEFIEPSRDADIGEQIRESAQVSVANQKASRVMFRALAQTDVIKTEDALDNQGMFPEWGELAGKEVIAGIYLRHEGGLYRVKQEHVIQAHYPPGVATAALYTRVQPDTGPEAWAQGKSYAKGVEVTHKAGVWLSGVDNNIWEPGAVGVYENIWKRVRKVEARAR